MAKEKKLDTKGLKWEEDPIEPFIFPDAKILILGTFPSPKARESGFYYAHYTNRFWKVLAEVLGEPLPKSNDEKKDMLKRHGIAVWNVIGACYIDGSKDSSVTEPRINDIAGGIKETGIKAIFTSGKLASGLYRKHCRQSVGIEDICLPSTSGANRMNFSFDRLVDEYSKILEWLQ